MSVVFVTLLSLTGNFSHADSAPQACDELVGKKAFMLPIPPLFKVMNENPQFARCLQASGDFRTSILVLCRGNRPTSTFKLYLSTMDALVSADWSDKSGKLETLAAAHDRAKVTVTPALHYVGESVFACMSHLPASR